MNFNRLITHALNNVIENNDVITESVIVEFINESGSGYEATIDYLMEQVEKKLLRVETNKNGINTFYKL